jgi:hypothetical protein
MIKHKKFQKRYLILFIVTLYFNAACKSQVNSNVYTGEVTSNIKSYDQLSEKYSDKLLLTSINTLYKRVTIKFNDSTTFDFPDIYQIDSLNRQSIKDSLWSFLKINNSDSIVNGIDNWCGTYILFDNFLSKHKQIYFEDVVLKTKGFNFGYYLSNQNQNINSLSLSQEQMLYLDFVKFLSKYPVNDRVDLLNNIDGLSDW